MATPRKKPETSSAEAVKPSVTELVPEDEPQLTYEQAREELLAVVNRLESGGESLAESMKLFTRGEYLANLCEQYLTDARALVEKRYSLLI
jgi:exodeoxyribonuclease VII small subunit